MNRVMVGFALVAAGFLAMGRPLCADPPLPETDSQRVRRLEQENASLRQEIAALRAEIASLKQNSSKTLVSPAAPAVARGATPAAPKTAGKTYTRLRDLISDLPEGRRPGKGQEWNNLLISRARQWHDEDTVGQRITLVLDYDNSGFIVGGKFEMNFEGIGFDFEGIHYYGMPAASLSDSLAEKAAKLKKGDKVKISGNIKQVVVNSAFGPPTIGLNVEIADATFEPESSDK